MGNHQIIYTSCRRGRFGSSDGQQIFSCDAEFHDYRSADVRRLFAYQHPALEPGVVMTDELAMTMPQAFIFRRLENGSCAFALNTYLGRDYMGANARFGNYMSHAVICDEESLEHYPCEYYGSSMLRDRMEYEEVNNPEPPDFLPPPNLCPGDRVDVERTIRFLGEGDRMERYKQMLHALLSGERDRKKVLICDEPEHIVLWIAALEYALPLKCALSINFATYEFDPLASPSRICGVAPSGTKYAPGTGGAARDCHVFDFIHDVMPDLDSRHDFLDFVEMAMTFSYDSMRAFHAFLAENYTYANADEDLYNAYHLYSLAADGLTDIDRETFGEAAAFLEQYAREHEIARIVGRLAEEQEALHRLDDGYFADVMTFLLKHLPKLNEPVRRILVERAAERAADWLNNADMDRGRFDSLFKALEEQCLARGVNLPLEMLREPIASRLAEIVRRDASSWKPGYLASGLCRLIRDGIVPVEHCAPDFPAGKLLAAIANSVFDHDPAAAKRLVGAMLDEMADNGELLLNLAFHLEGVLLDLQDSGDAVADLWARFNRLAGQLGLQAGMETLALLERFGRYDQMPDLFEAMLRGSGRDVGGLLRAYCVRFEPHRRDEHRPYLSATLQRCDRHMRAHGGEETDKTRGELLDIVLNLDLEDPLVARWIEETAAGIPILRRSSAQTSLISRIYDYFMRHPVLDPGPRTRLLLAGWLADGAGGVRDFGVTLEEFGRWARQRKADVSCLAKKEAAGYVDRIASGADLNCLNASEWLRFFRLFDLSPEWTVRFVHSCARSRIRSWMKTGVPGVIGEFLIFVMETGNPAVMSAAARAIGKMGTKDAEVLDQVMNMYLSRTDAYQSYKPDWINLTALAFPEHPSQNGIGRWFRRLK